MKRLLLLVCIALTSVFVNAQIRFTAVNPANSLITIQNFGSASVNIQNYNLCALFEYSSLSGLSVTVVAGSLDLAAGASVTIEWLASTGFNPTASDLGLYLPNSSFSNPASMVDFMQYGAAGQGRENVAQQAGLWQAGTFLTGSGPWSYMGDGTQNNISFWQAAVPGCMNPIACNYNSAATEDDNSCLLPGSPCDDGNELTFFDVLSTDCICEGTTMDFGCTLDVACNYNSNASIDDGSCLFPGDACDDNDPLTENDIYNVDCGCEGTPTMVMGCTLDAACNYNPDATMDDGSCLFPGDACDDDDPTTENDQYNADCGCEGTPAMVSGCTFDVACNYNPDANSDDGSCLFPGDACDDNNPSTVNDLYNIDCDCVGTPTGIEETVQLFKSFPNPSNRAVRIESAQGRIIEQITVRDLQGRVVIEQQVWSAGVTLEVWQLTSGRYVASILTIDSTYIVPLDVLHFR